LTMQMKDPDILVNWLGGVEPLATIAHSTGYGDDALALTRRYRELWSLSVYVRDRSATHLADVEKAAATLFEG
jgi:hypothetical protein